MCWVMTMCHHFNLSQIRELHMRWFLLPLLCAVLVALCVTNPDQPSTKMPDIDSAAGPAFSGDTSKSYQKSAQTTTHSESEKSLATPLQDCEDEFDGPLGSLQRIAIKHRFA